MQGQHVTISGTDDVLLDSVAVLEADFDEALFLLLWLFAKDTELQPFAVI